MSAENGSPAGGYVEEEQIPRAGRLGHAVAAAVPLVVGAGALAYSLSLGLGTAVDPGPGLWPAVASGILVLASLWSLAFERRGETVERFTRGALGIGLGLLSLVAYVLLFRRIGFEVPTLLVLAFWLRLLGRESWLVTAVVSGATTVAFYVLFVVLLGVPLPRLAVG